MAGAAMTSGTKYFVGLIRTVTSVAALMCWRRSSVIIAAWSRPWIPVAMGLGYKTPSMYSQYGFSDRRRYSSTETRATLLISNYSSLTRPHAFSAFAISFSVMAPSLITFQ